MQGRRCWVEAGKIGSYEAGSVHVSTSEERNKFNAGQIRLTTGDLGTEIKWHVQSPCYASLFVVLERIKSARLPIVFRFYLSGWFEEFHQSSVGAILRLEEIIARGDRHVSTRTLVKQFDLREKPLTSLFKHCIDKPDGAEDFAVECVFEKNTEQFSVRKIGTKSVIGQVWGTFLSSFPCQVAGQYGQVVSEAYREVLHSGKPRYDHVLAAMRMPDNNVFWVPYHRLVLPKKHNLSDLSVLVVAELNQVDIHLI